ncbi:MAG: hypothetical protein K0S25_640 [Bacillus sp. (in: firmicutes)]|jgi:hypothetical protein|nr:hypothetical protein [Bacillus sp. (in: firmicutes)]
MLIGVEGAKTPAGAEGQVNPAGALAPRRLTARPLGARSAWNGNQHPSLKEPFIKLVLIPLNHAKFRLDLRLL